MNSRQNPEMLVLHFCANSTADTCKNCAKCGKGFKIGTHEAYKKKTKIRLGGISKIFCFCSHAIWLPQTKAFH